jgi:hypothetical protein
MQIFFLKTNHLPEFYSTNVDLYNPQRYTSMKYFFSVFVEIFRR